MNAISKLGLLIGLLSISTPVAAQFPAQIQTLISNGHLNPQLGSCHLFFLHDFIASQEPLIGTNHTAI